MADILNRSPSTRHLGAFKTRKASVEKPLRGESYQHQQLSRFVSGALGLTAQSNPNWRTRPNTDDSSTTNESSYEMKRTRREQNPAGSSDDLKCQEPLLSAMLTTTTRETKARMRDTAKPTSNYFQILADSDYSEDEGFYEVYKHIDLGPLREDGGPLRLLELGLPQDGNSQHLVKLQRFNRDTKMHIGRWGNGQKEQLRVARQTGAVASRKELSSSCSSRSFSDNQSAPAINVRKTSTNTVVADKGFERILQKLTRNAEQSEKGEADAKSEKVGETSKLRRPIQWSGRRAGTSSEPHTGLNYGRVKLHKKDDTSDSGIGMEDYGKFRTLNPRAREFLSQTEFPPLRFREDSAISGCSSQEFQPFAGVPMASKVGKPPTPLESHLPANTMVDHVPQYQPSPVASGIQPGFGYGSMPPIPPMLLENLLSGGLLPVAPDQLQCLGPAPSLTPLPLSTLTTQPVLQPITGNMLSLPPTPLLNTVFPVAGPMNPCLVAPSCPMPAPGPATRPPPVPKPRRPDPSDQQAYEAWIEWRKANEPGYALECKLRQQRRAQRNLMDKSKAKPVKKAEGTASA